MDATKLKEILDLHKKYLYGGEGRVCADLGGANLTGANLTDAILSYANLRSADLRYADLKDAILRHAILYHADLEGADLTGAILSYASLSYAVLSGANLSGADLSGADLSYAILRGADLTDANLEGANLPDFQICPQDGAIIAFKKVRCGFILKLEIPADAKRTSSLIGRKCRASKARVLEALNTNETEFYSIHDPHFIYKVGETVEASDFNDDIREECKPGIHFFMTLEEAIKY